MSKTSFIAGDDGHRFFLMANPPPPKWEMRLAKKGDAVFYLKVAPNAFHRWMQRVLLGIYWEKA